MKGAVSFMEGRPYTKPNCTKSVDRGALVWEISTRQKKTNYGTTILF
jgi:hypothetical protein